MEVATLSYIPDKNKIVPSDACLLAQGDLRAINHWTSYFDSEESLLENPVYAERVKEYKRKKGILVAPDPIVKIFYIRDESSMEILDPLYDSRPIQVRNDLSNSTFSEAEKARKLMLNSKNQKFAEYVLKSKRLAPTLRHTLTMTYEEAKEAKELGLNVIERDGEYRISIREMLKYSYFRGRGKWQS